MFGMTHRTGFATKVQTNWSST